MPWGRRSLFVDILWRWMALWATASALYITVGLWIDGDGGAESGPIDPVSAVFLGLLYGVFVGVVFGGPTGLVAGAVGAALLAPYRGKTATIWIMCGLAVAIATATVSVLLSADGLNPSDTVFYRMTIGAGLAAATGCRWLTLGVRTRGEAERAGGHTCTPSPGPAT
jgi:hypothetical protein